jgi:arylsulfatase
MNNIPTTTRRGFVASLAPAVLRGWAADAPPNVLFVICDQMRGDALGCLGNPNARTPNLDRMAAKGVLFENCSTNNPVCIPSRKSIFSGLYPHQHGSLTNQQHDLLNLPGTMLDHFRKLGYRTGYIGKNHAYQKPVFAAVDRVSIRDREAFRAYNKFVPPHWHCDTYWPEEKCHPTLNTNEATAFINQARSGQPFFLTVSYFDPHPPYMAPSDFVSRYCSSQMKLPRFVAPAAVSRRLADHARAMGFNKLSDADLTETMKYYYAAIESGVDLQVGRLLKTLDEKGISGNTVVVFTSDHGDFMADHRMVRKGMFLHDSLLHVPMIWYAPGRISEGKRVKRLAQLIDLFPTLVDLTGGRQREDLMGQSLKRVLQGEEREDTGHAVYTSAAYGDLDFSALAGDSDKPLHTRVLDQNMKPAHRTSVIRTREWKLVLNESCPPELQRTEDGWTEKENLAEKKQFAGIRRELESKLTRWWQW